MVEIIFLLQEQFSCCGVDNHTEWILISSGAKTSPFPESCLCPDDDHNGCLNITATHSSNNTEVFYTHSLTCGSLVLEDLHNILLVPRVAGPVVAVVECVIALLAVYVLHHVDNHSLVGLYIVPEGNNARRSAVAERQATGDKTAENGSARQPSGAGVGGGGDLSGAGVRSSDGDLSGARVRNVGGVNSAGAVGGGDGAFSVEQGGREGLNVGKLHKDMDGVGVKWHTNTPSVSIMTRDETVHV
jgi:hypothetical protein